MSETSDSDDDQIHPVEIDPTLVNHIQAAKLWGDFDTRSIEVKEKFMMFWHWSEVFKDLNGSPETLTKLNLEFENTETESKNCDKILNEIRKLPGGKKTIFEHYMKYDQMKRNHQDIAELFKRITEGTFIRKKTKTDSKGNQKTLIYKSKLAGPLLGPFRLARLPAMDPGSIARVIALALGQFVQARRHWRRPRRRWRGG